MPRRTLSQANPETPSFWHSETEEVALRIEYEFLEPEPSLIYATVDVLRAQHIRDASASRFYLREASVTFSPCRVSFDVLFPATDALV